MPPLAEGVVEGAHRSVELPPHHRTARRRDFAAFRWTRTSGACPIDVQAAQARSRTVGSTHTWEALSVGLPPHSGDRPTPQGSRWGFRRTAAIDPPYRRL